MLDDCKNRWMTAKTRLAGRFETNLAIQTNQLVNWLLDG